MAVEYRTQDYSTAKQILAFPDHYVAVAHTFFQNDAAAVTTPEGRKIIKAGTIYPSNDANAIGIVFNEMDVTFGDRTGALLIHGFVKTAALPQLPTTNAKSALKQIQFMPMVAITTTIDAVKVSIAAGEAEGTTHTIRVYINGAKFRKEAVDLGNWTITGEGTTKVKVNSIVVAESGAYVDITTINTAAAVAGDVTIVPKAGATTTGDVPTSALTIVTVA